MPVTAETLASKLSDCGVPLAPAPLAAAALKVCHYHGPTAAQVIRHGLANPRDPYEYVDGLAPGPSHGDPVFKHPWVQTLLEVARDRVKQALDQQPGPAEDKWLICIRTFGRPGVRCQQSELHRFLFGVLLPCAAKILEEKLEAANLSLPALRKMAKRPLKSFQEELKKAGVGRVHPETAKRLSETLCEPLEKVEKKLNLSEKGLRELTLAALELALGPEAYKRCLIFVSHTDEAWTSGKYDAALSGTHWADRVVVGIRGAHLQVRFMEEAAPKGSHIVVMDDNIQSLMVEIPEDSVVAERKAAGVVNCCTQPLTHEASCFNPLAGTGLSTMDEPELMCFLRTVCPELQKRKNTRKVVEILLKMQVTSMKKFKCLPKQRIDALFEALRLSAKKQKKCLDATRCKTKLPIPRVLTKPSEGCEGELQLQESKKHGTKAELFQLICRAGREMQKHGVHVWGVNPSKNHFFLKGRGDSIRKMAESNGVVQDYSSGLGLVFGAWFGFRVTHSPQFYTRQGQIKDDVERTLRYWHADKKLLRFVRYGADKNGFRPGQFKSNKGGISSNSSQQDHSTEAETAIRSLIQEFGQYVRLPKKNEKSSCGLIWSDGRISKRRKKSLVHPPSKRCRL